VASKGGAAQLLTNRLQSENRTSCKRTDIKSANAKWLIYKIKLERAKGFEPSTPTLARLRSFRQQPLGSHTFLWWPTQPTDFGKHRSNHRSKSLIRTVAIMQLIDITGAPEEIRTPDPQIRSLTV
jgi:hypothetical protein